MTAKDYEVVARVIRGATTARQVAEDLIPVLRVDNPRFDAEKWLRACGVEPGVAPSNGGIR